MEVIVCVCNRLRKNAWPLRIPKSTEKHRSTWKIKAANMLAPGINDLWVRDSRSPSIKIDSARGEMSRSRKRPFLRGKHGPRLSCDVAEKLFRISDWRIASKIAWRVNNRYVFASHETSRGMSAFQMQQRVHITTATKTEAKRGLRWTRERTLWIWNGILVH